jgi:hypothetical protein
MKRVHHIIFSSTNTVLCSTPLGLGSIVSSRWPWARNGVSCEDVVSHIDQHVKLGIKLDGTDRENHNLIHVDLHKRCGCRNLAQWSRVVALG